jgi:hypothetical protein
MAPDKALDQSRILRLTLSMPLELSLAEQAAVWQRALRARYVSSQMAVEWADKIIADSEQPPVALLDISLGGQSDPADLARYLDPLAQDVEQSPRVVASELALMADALAHDESTAERIAWALRDLCDDRLRAHPWASELFVLPYSWDPTESAWVPTPEQAVARLRAMLPQLRDELASAI